MARIAAILVVVLACLGGAAKSNAQTSDQSERLQAAQQLAETMGPILVRQIAEGAAAGAWKQIETALKAKYPTIDDATLDDLRMNFQKSLEEVAVNSMKQVPDIYARYFTASELRELAQFYKTPLGAKLLTETPKITQDMMPVIMQSNISYKQKIDADFTAILKKHGYK